MYSNTNKMGPKYITLVENSIRSIVKSIKEVKSEGSKLMMAE